MSQYLDQQGLQTLVTKTKEYARKSAKEAVNTSAAAASKTIIDWNDATSAAIYGDIKIAESQVTGLENDLALKAPLASPAFTGVPTAPTAAAGTNTTQIATTEFVQTAIGTVAEAMLYKGAVDSTHLLPTDDYKAGWTYKVAVAGTYAGQVCEVGDLIIANKNYASGASNADWDVIQTNIDGAVSGPASATSGAFVLFDGTTGKKIMNSEFSPSSFKTIQTAVTKTNDSALKTVDTVTQNANGEINVTYKPIQTATTSQAGVVQLSSSSASIDEDVAATPKAVKDAYDVLNSTKQDNLEFEDAYDASTNKVATKTTVSKAIEALNAVVDSSDGTNIIFKVTENGGKITDVKITKDATVNSGDVSTMITSAIGDLDVKAISVDTSATITSISEVDGKISVSSSPIAITTDQITDFKATLDGKADKVSGATAGHLAALDAKGNLTDAGVTSASFKTVQSAVSDPTASGDAVSFIDTISQDKNGVITVTKKTVQSASSTQSGLMSAADFNKLAGITSGANKVEVDQSTGVLSINGTSAMGPISTSEINGLFSD